MKAMFVLILFSMSAWAQNYVDMSGRSFRILHSRPSEIYHTRKTRLSDEMRFWFQSSGATHVSTSNKNQCDNPKMREQYFSESLKLKDFSNCKKQFGKNWDVVSKADLMHGFIETALGKLLVNKHFSDEDNVGIMLKELEFHTFDPVYSSLETGCFPRIYFFNDFGFNSSRYLEPVDNVAIICVCQKGSDCK